MAVFIEARTDPFIENRNRLTGSIARGRGRSWNSAGLNIRRPTRGVQIKPNTYAIIRIMDKDGNFIPVIDAAGEIRQNNDGRGYNQFYTNFLVQTVGEQRSEKQQIQETFGDWFIYFYGSAPEILQVQGFLLNTDDFNWHNEFWENYERYFKGTKLVEKGARLYFIFDDMMVEGYMINANATLNQDNLSIIPFSFSIVVMSYSSITFTGDPRYPTELPRTDTETFSLLYSAVQKQVTPASMKFDLGIQGLIKSAIGGGATLAASLRAKLSFDPGTTNLYETFKLVRNNNNPRELPKPGYGEFKDNLDEFIVRSVHLVNNGEFRSMPGQVNNGEFRSMPEDEWSNISNSIDDSVTSATNTDSAGNAVNTTSSEYSDLMGRSGQAATQTVSRAPGNMEGLPPAVRNRADPFGMMQSGGDLM
jgi:hypothetical protein